MAAPAVAQVLRMIDQRHVVTQLSKLSDLDPAELDAARAALEKVPAQARVDVGALVDTVRAEVAERRRSEAARRRAEASPWRYAITLMSREQLIAVRDEIQRTGDVAAAMSRASRKDPGLPEPAARPKPKRSLPRVRSRRERLRTPDDAVPGPVRAEPPAETETSEEERPQRRRARWPLGATLVGDAARPRGCAVDADYRRWATPSRPPWLIDEAPDEVLDEDLDDEEFST